MIKLIKNYLGRKYFFEFFQYGLALALSSYGFYLLKYSHEANFSSTGEVISDGFIENPKNDVRFKTPGDLDWNFAEDKTGVRFGDSIFTGEDSSVNLNIKSLNLSLEANTLIHINQLEKTFMLNLARGAMQAVLPEGQNSILIQVGLEKFKVVNRGKTTASFVLSNPEPSNELKKIGLSVDQGRIQFQTEKGDLIDGESGQNILFKAINGHATNIDKINFQIQTPSENKLIIENEILSISFSWTGPPQTKFSLKIAGGSNSHLPELQEIQPTASKNLLHFNQKGISTSGSYFLQIEAATPSGDHFKTKALPIHIVSLRPPIIYDSTIKYFDPTRSMAALQFERISFLDHFDIQFAHDQQFKNIFNSQKSSQFNPQFVMSKPGQIFLRARYQLKGVEPLSLWSEIVAIDIPLPIPAPKVRISNIDLKNRSASVEWPVEPRAQNYEVTWLGKNPLSRNPPRTIAENSLSLSLKKRTPQIISVTAYANQKIKSLSSSPIILPGLVPEPHWVSFERTAPPLSRVESKQLSKIQLRWALDGPMKESVLEISGDKSFKNKKTQIINAAEMSFLSESTETIYARVKEQVPPDEYLAEYSSVAILAPKTGESISPPNLTLPKNNETILFPKNFAASVDLSWTPCSGAFGYDIEIGPFSSSVKSNSRVYTVIKSKYIFSKPAPGVYQWRVRCFDRYSQSNWGPFGRFKIIYGI